MTFKFSARSLKNLEGVHPDMVRLVTRALDLTEQDFMVIEGVRTKDRQKALYAQGRTTPGPVVTWTLNSPHLPGSDGFGRAVDLLPAPADWSDPSKFIEIWYAMALAAQELKIPFRWGADWDQDGKPRERGETDSPHYELA